MKAASPELAALLASGVFVYADVFTFELVGGTDETYRLRYTSHQQDLHLYLLDGDPIRRTFVSGFGITGLRAKASIGVSVDEQTLAITFPEGALIQDVPAREAVLWGALDGAFVRRDRYYFADWDGSPPVGGLPKFYGLVSTFDQIGRMDCTLRAKSGMVLLDQPMPRHLTGPTCVNRIYNPACGLDRDALAVHGVVEAGATTSFIPWAAGSDAGFSLGRVFMEDLGLVGVWRSIKSADAAGLTLAFPLPAVPLAGEHFTAYPGCNRTHPRCVELGNEARFRGFRFVPQSEKAI
jgi:hypothetical protein